MMAATKAAKKADTSKAEKPIESLYGEQARRVRFQAELVRLRLEKKRADVLPVDFGQEILTLWTNVVNTALRHLPDHAAEIAEKLEAGADNMPLAARKALRDATHAVRTEAALRLNNGASLVEQTADDELRATMAAFLAKECR